MSDLCAEQQIAVPDVCRGSFASFLAVWSNVGFTQKATFGQGRLTSSRAEDHQAASSVVFDMKDTADAPIGIKTLGELITLAKSEPYQLIIGTNPAGSLPHMAAILFVQMSQAPLTVVPSNGGTNEAIREIRGGRAHVVIDALPALRGAIDAGDLKPLAIMTRERVPTEPDLPIAAETVPGLFALGWTALVAPKGTPPAVVRQLTDDLRKVIESTETKDRLERVGVTPFRPAFAADLARFIEGEQKLWWPIVEAEQRK